MSWQNPELTSPELAKQLATLSWQPPVFACQFFNFVLLNRSQRVSWSGLVLKLSWHPIELAFTWVCIPPRMAAGSTENTAMATNSVGCTPELCRGGTGARKLKVEGSETPEFLTPRVPPQLSPYITRPHSAPPPLSHFFKKSTSTQPSTNSALFSPNSALRIHMFAKMNPCSTQPTHNSALFSNWF